MDSFRFYTSSLLLTYDASDYACGGSPACLSPRGSGSSVLGNESRQLSGGDLQEILIEGGGGGSCDDGGGDRADLRLIDFANSTHGGLSADTGGVLHEGPDHGFIFGLDTLLAMLRDLKEGKGVGEEGEVVVADEEEEDDDDDDTTFGEDVANE